MANRLVLPDSNFYIRCTLAGFDPFVELSKFMDEHDFITCGMVALEVIRGRSNPHVMRRFQERFAVMICIPTTNQIWESATQLAWRLDRQGIVLPAQDILIAAHALQVDATILTHDAHFQHIPGLRVVERLT